MIFPFIISFLISYILVLLAIAFYTLMERKFLGYFQLRKGPNKVSLIGIPQPFADAIKLFTKEQTYPSITNKIMFIIAPILGLILALLLWAIYPHSHPAIFIIFGIIYFLCVSSLSVYSTFIAGWCSNSKYSLLGSLRSIAQTISYEVSLSLILLSALIIHQSIDINTININIISWTSLLVPPIILTWFVTTLAETNRTPFDFAEGESELVSGFNTEYRSGIFALIFIAEYTRILIISILRATLFIGTTILLLDSWLIILTMCFATIFIWLRATLPRIRYDNLIYLAWKSFLPLRLASLIIITPVIIIILSESYKHMTFNHKKTFVSDIAPVERITLMTLIMDLYPISMNLLSTSSITALLVPPLVFTIAWILSIRAQIHREKASPFECGFDPLHSARIPFSIRFFLLAVIFVVFDIEIVLLIPIPILIIKTLICAILIASTLFLLILILGLLHEWLEGSLDWSN